ncbi:hypothetical protein Pmani_035779 [Petrolisthes manimaculis]|uniref:Uncharacterized protein n=1 Tax=Petrolisthes manimaculis TaxID=1843537 RepID=A0AAE1TMU8_9EUCA|nr:hypothetical protein Pmani_035779 [Petrolisthes manimaculis]
MWVVTAGWRGDAGTAGGVVEMEVVTGTSGSLSFTTQVTLFTPQQQVAPPQRVIFSGEHNAVVSFILRST